MVGGSLKEIILRPPVIGLFYLVVAYFIDLIFDVYRIISYPYTLIGVLFLMFGFFIATKALKVFNKVGTTKDPFGEPTALGTEGVFKYSRNPMYVGLVSITFGIAILFGSIVFFLAPLKLFLTLNFYFIPKEEKKLEKIFGKNYLDYKKKVRRWL